MKDYAFKGAKTTRKRSGKAWSQDPALSHRRPDDGLRRYKRKETLWNTCKLIRGYAQKRRPFHFWMKPYRRTIEGDRLLSRVSAIHYCSTHRSPKRKAFVLPEYYGNFLLLINSFRNADFPVCAKAIRKKRGALSMWQKGQSCRRDLAFMDAPVTEDPKQRKSELWFPVR